MTAKPSSELEGKKGSAHHVPVGNEHGVALVPLDAAAGLIRAGTDPVTSREQVDPVQNPWQLILSIEL